MKKLLTAAIILISFSSHADELKLLEDGPFNVKKIVKVKLWFEGIEITKENREQLESHMQTEMPEELEVALEKYDS